MAFNKWKSTSVYGIFNNHNLTDASMNIITNCEANFDGPLTANLINSTTSINAVDGIFSADVTCVDMSSNTINSVTINGTTMNGTDGNFSGDLICIDMSSNTIHTATINGSTLNVTTLNGTDGNFSGDLTCVDMSCNTIHSTTINGTTLNVTTLNTTDFNFTGAISSDDTITGNVVTSTTAVNCVTLNTDVINCSDLLDINRVDALELNTDVLNVNETIGCDVFTCNEINTNGYTYIDVPQTLVSSSFSGQIVCSMPFRGATYKKVILWCDASIGNTTYTFPVAFTYLPKNITGNSGQVTALSTTSVTVGTSVSTSVFIILEGF